MSAGKTISLAKAKAGFGAMLRLAERFDFVKIMHGNRLLGVLTSGQRWQKRGWFMEMESIPIGALAENNEQSEFEKAFANALWRRPRSVKSKPIRVVKARKVAGRWIGAKVRLSRKRVVAAIRADRDAR